MRKKWLSSLGGKAAEYAFASECSKRELMVNFPSTDLAPFDFIVHNGNSCALVQVKSTKKKRKGESAYEIHTNTGQAGHKYEDDDFDFLVAVISSTSPCYYIIPRKAFDTTSIRLYPDGTKGKFEQYKEAWHLLKDFGT